MEDEDFFRVLKSGCRTEFLLFRTADRMQRAVAINAVIAHLGGHRARKHDPDPVHQFMRHSQTRLGSTPSGRTARLSSCITYHDLAGLTSAHTTRLCPVQIIMIDKRGHVPPLVNNAQNNRCTVSTIQAFEKDDMLLTVD